MKDRVYRILVSGYKGDDDIIVRKGQTGKFIQKASSCVGSDKKRFKYIYTLELSNGYLVDVYPHHLKLIKK